MPSETVTIWTTDIQDGELTATSTQGERTAKQIKLVDPSPAWWWRRIIPLDGRHTVSYTRRDAIQVRRDGTAERLKHLLRDADRLGQELALCDAELAKEES